MYVSMKGKASKRNRYFNYNTNLLNRKRKIEYLAYLEICEN